MDREKKNARQDLNPPAALSVEMYQKRHKKGKKTWRCHEGLKKEA